MLNELSQRHDTSLNWDYPPDPGPWNADDYAGFDEAADKLLKSIQQELVKSSRWCTKNFSLSA